MTDPRPHRVLGPRCKPCSSNDRLAPEGYEGTSSWAGQMRVLEWEKACRRERVSGEGREKSVLQAGRSHLITLWVGWGGLGQDGERL